MVHAGRMTIIPADLDGVATDDLDSGGADSGFHLVTLDRAFAGVLVHATRARAEKAEFRIRNREFARITETQENFGVVERLNFGRLNICHTQVF